MRPKVYFPPEIWVCPGCGGQVVLDGMAVWCGKNLECSKCGEFHYYTEFRVKPRTAKDK